MILYHGTTVYACRKILKEGFKPDRKYNWRVKSKKGFVYLSLAYAPFYAMMAESKSKDRAIIEVHVPDHKLYPEDDFIMYAMGYRVFTQEQLDAVDFEKNKHFWAASLKYLGNAAAKPEDIIIERHAIFNSRRLWMKCDPTITPINYLVMGEYYNKLSKHLVSGKTVEEFKERVFPVGQH